MPSIRLDELIEEQKRVAAKVRYRSLRLKKIRRVCGVDVSYQKGRAVAYAVTWDAKKDKIESVSFHHSDEEFPYLPGFLYKRELVPMVQAVRSLEVAPDLILVDGHGIAHPRRAGLAVFVGVNLKMPTIGIAKSLLIGEIGEGSKIFLPITINRKRVGWLFRKKNSRKYFASPGNMVRVDDIPSIASIWNYDYPAPLRYADKLSKRETAKWV